MKCVYHHPNGLVRLLLHVLVRLLLHVTTNYHGRTHSVFGENFHYLSFKYKFYEKILFIKKGHI